MTDDPTEDWLLDHDPDHAIRSEDWRHVKGRGVGTVTDEYAPDINFYEAPSQETAWGGDGDLDILLYPTEEGAHRVNQYVRPVGNRLCESCGAGYVPIMPWHRFCTDACRQKAGRKRRGK